METDLSLIGIEDLIEEIRKRKDAFVLAYIDYDGGVKTVKSKWGGDFIDINGLSNILLNSINMSSLEDDIEELDDSDD